MQARAGRSSEKLASMAAYAHGVGDSAGSCSAQASRARDRVETARGDLLREHRGVYRVGHRAPAEATYLAAVLAAGEGAVLCGRAAAHLWG